MLTRRGAGPPTIQPGDARGRHQRGELRGQRRVECGEHHESRSPSSTKRSEI